MIALLFIFVLVSVFVSAQGEVGFEIDDPRDYECDIGQRIMRLSDLTNAHGFGYARGTGDVEICYDEIFGVGYVDSREVSNVEHVCGGIRTNDINTVFFVSSDSNAHTNNYPETTPSPICYGDLVCNTRTACESGEELIVSLSAENNGHLAVDDSYPFQVCCTSAFADGDVTPECLSDVDCGEGFVCDEETGTCSEVSVCGDGVWDEDGVDDIADNEDDEGCDDGCGGDGCTSADDGDGCSSTCEVENICNNDVIERPNDDGVFEQCDGDEMDDWFNCAFVGNFLLSGCEPEICISSSCNNCMVEFEITGQECGDGNLESCELCEPVEGGDDLFQDDLTLKCSDFGYVGCTIELNTCTDSCTPELDVCDKCPSADEFCGDDIIQSLDVDDAIEGYEYVEKCDGERLDDWACEDFGYGSGVLGCTDECVFDFALCIEGEVEEDCGNGVDDDNDELVDCLDEECVGNEEFCLDPCDDACSDEICHAREAEVCANDLDDNCDGTVNEGCEVVPPIVGCIGDPNNYCDEGEDCTCADCHGFKIDGCTEQVCDFSTEICVDCASGSFDSATGMCLPKVFNVRITSPDSDKPLDEKMFVKGEMIDFKQESDNSAKDISIEWGFGDGEGEDKENCLTSPAGSCDTTHSYDSFGWYVASAQADEQGGVNSITNYTEFLIYDKGINVFAIISSPAPGEIVQGGSGEQVSFDASGSFVANCFEASDDVTAEEVCEADSDKPTTNDCYSVGDTLSCYDLLRESDVIGTEYDLLFEWEFKKGEDYSVFLNGTWSDKFDEVVFFDRAFFRDGNYTAGLTVTYGEFVGNGGDCAAEGESYSDVETDYPESCCTGLDEWESGMDTSISIGDECYGTGLLSGWPVGTCINKGDEICSDLESPCNSPDDCTGGVNADYEDVDKFCNEDLGDGTTAYDSYCGEDILVLGLDLCDLCVEVVV